MDRLFLFHFVVLLVLEFKCLQDRKLGASKNDLSSDSKTISVWCHCEDLRVFTLEGLGGLRL